MGSQLKVVSTCPSHWAPNTGSLWSSPMLPDICMLDFKACILNPQAEECAAVLRGGLAISFVFSGTQLSVCLPLSPASAGFESCSGDRRLMLGWPGHLYSSFSMQNVFLTQSGKVKLGDFGSARLLSRYVPVLVTEIWTAIFRRASESLCLSVVSAPWPLHVRMWERLIMCLQKFGKTCPITIKGG